LGAEKQGGRKYLCYFIHLIVKEQNKQSYAEKRMKFITDKVNNSSNQYLFRIDGDYPEYCITYGGCSCDLLSKPFGSFKFDLELIKEVLFDESIKYVDLRIFWGDDLSVCINKEYIHIEDLFDINENKKLKKIQYIDYENTNKFFDSKNKVRSV